VSPGEFEYLILVVRRPGWPSAGAAYPQVVEAFRLPHSTENLVPPTHSCARTVRYVALRNEVIVLLLWRSHVPHRDPSITADRQ
jgi:hypothetical protein